MPTDKRPAEIDVREAMLLGLEIGDLPDVVGDGVEEGARDVLCLERRGRLGLVFFRDCDAEGFRGGVGFVAVAVCEAAAVFGFALCFAFHAEDLPEGGGDGARFEADFAVVGAVDVADEHVDFGVVAFFRHAEHFVEGARPS